MKKIFKKIILFIAISSIFALSYGCNKSSSASGKTQLIAVPDDATNLSRAIKLLEKAGLIEVDPKVGYSPELKDITNYLYNIEIVPIQANTLPATLADYSCSIINGTYAVPAGLLPSKDALIIEQQSSENNDNPYVNIVVARTADKNNSDYIKIANAVKNQTVADYIIGAYNEMYYPAFDFQPNSSISKEFIDKVTKYKSSKDGKKVVKLGVCGQNNLYWNEVQKILDDENAGLYIELIEFDAYNLPNQALANKEIDLNSFQHIAYLNKEIEATNFELTPIGNTIIAPLSLYSKNFNSLDEFKNSCKK